MAAYFQRVPGPVGIAMVVLAALVLLAWLSARRSPDDLPAVVWAALGAVAAYFLAVLLAKGLGQSRPYHTLKHVEVLVRPLTQYGFPDSRVAVGGAVVCGLALARRWGLLVLAVAAGLLLALAGVYVGVDYPSDVVGGAVFGAAVDLLTWPLAARALVPLLSRVALGPFGRLAQVRGGPRDKRPSAGRPMRAPKMPTAEAMEALRAATEAARAQSEAARAGAAAPGGAEDGTQRPQDVGGSP